MDYNRSIASHIKSKRLEAGITQKKLAEKMDCAQSYISKLEQGKIHLEIIVAYKICKCIGISFNKLINEIEADLDALSG